MLKEAYFKHTVALFFLPLTNGILKFVSGKMFRRIFGVFFSLLCLLKFGSLVQFCDKRFWVRDSFLERNYSLDILDLFICSRNNLVLVELKLLESTITRVVCIAWKYSHISSYTCFFHYLLFILINCVGLSENKLLPLKYLLW